VRRGGKLGGKPGEVELTVKPRWWQWRLQIRRGGTVSGARDRSRELATWKKGGGGARARTKGERGGGRRLVNRRRERERVWRRGERRRRGQRGCTM
jgi:hypothetical protein